MATAGELIQAARVWRGTARYQRQRRQFLRSHPLCAICNAAGLIVAAVELDHVEPIFRGGAFWDARNWQALCRSCHARKTVSERDDTPDICLHGYTADECDRCTAGG